VRVIADGLLSDSKLGLRSSDQKFDNQPETYADLTHTLEISVIDRSVTTRGGTILYASEKPISEC